MSSNHPKKNEPDPSPLHGAGGGGVLIFAFSAKSRDHLKKKIADVLPDCGVEGSQQACAAAQESRKRFSPADHCRLIMAVPAGGGLRDYAETAASLIDSGGDSNADASRAIFFGEGTVPGKIAFLFPGQGSQYVGMGRDLFAFFPETIEIIDDMERFLGQETSLKPYIFPDPAGDPETTKQREVELRQTDIAQPAIGAVSILMYRLLTRFGVVPDAAAGHSFGELAALFAARRISESDFSYLSVWRGRLMAAACGTDAGQMLAVRAAPEKIAELVCSEGADVMLANKNSPEQGVVSGASAEIDRVYQICRKNRIRAMLLPVSAAFHSRLVSDAAAGFCKKIEGVSFLPDGIPVYSNETALPYPPEAAASKRVLGSHLVSPVNFTDQVKNMYADGVRVFVEVGPKNVLTGLVRAILKGNHFQAFAVDAASGRQNGVDDLAAALGRLAAAGYAVDLEPRGETEASAMNGLRVSAL